MLEEKYLLKMEGERENALFFLIIRYIPKLGR